MHPPQQIQSCLKWKTIKTICVFLFQKYGKFCSISLDNFIRHIISEEWHILQDLFEFSFESLPSEDTCAKIFFLNQILKQNTDGKHVFVVKSSKVWRKKIFFFFCQIQRLIKIICTNFIHHLKNGTYVLYLVESVVKKITYTGIIGQT